MSRIAFDVEGMTCEGCVKNVKKALERIDGVDVVEVTLKPGAAVVDVKDGGPEVSVIVSALEDAGFDAKPKA